MAATVSTRILEDGPRNAVLWVEGSNGATGANPGTGGADLAYQQLILPSALGYIDIARKLRAAQLRIDSIEWDVQAEASMRVDLFWDASPTPAIAYSCIGRANKWFKDVGGLYVPSGLAGATGGIGISTTNAPATFAAYTIMLRLVKQ
ncbi:hypothetical protein [Burkholderia aenigmatica]|uniref:hypothetical protein n=1 Tax=Burkholderia aenigmatica TaxID=2015348 RepID=UPI0026506C13|nr:hypothetical protein [Burkholderia aenigmatica]MDN7881251.1 hypothetical protein [Burkholderia aenigmatica]